jgi:vacuolar-type H+-ATPase subunit H
MSSSRGDYALEQEKFGLSQIEKANAEKDNLLAIAKKMAKKDLESYDDEMRKECMNKITELTSNTEVIEEIQNKNRQEIEIIQKQYNENKDKVVDFLFQNVIKVYFEVPDVVKGCFEEKFGIKEEDYIKK